MAAMLHLLGADSATLRLLPAVPDEVPGDGASSSRPDWPAGPLEFVQCLARAVQIKAAIFQFTQYVENQVDVRFHDFTHMGIQ